MPTQVETQLQRFSDERARPGSEQSRAFLRMMLDDKAAIDDVYAAIAGGNTWKDARTDGPPHLITGNDILAYNTFITDIAAAILAHPNLPVILKMCVRKQE